MAPSPALPGSTSLADGAAVTRRVTIYSVATACVLIVVKLWAVLASGSVAMLSSLADSGLDLIASLATFYAVRYAAAPPDAEHRFGHGKAEGFASMLQAGLVFATGALIGREAAVRLIAPVPVTQSGEAVTAAIVSIALTGLLVALQTRALKQTRSVAVEGDRTHYAADLLSNFAALAGVAAAGWLGLAWADAVAGLFVAALLLWGAMGVFREAADQLMDKGLGPEDQARIVELVTADRAIFSVHGLRTRVAGPIVMMQMHVDLDPALTLEQAHKLVVAAENRILSAFPAADILMHPDPRGRAEPHGGAFAEHHEEGAHAPRAAAT